MLARDSASYLAALIDGEGSVSQNPRGRQVVVVYNKDMAIIEAARECCEELGIRVYLSVDKRHDCYSLRCSNRASFEIISQLPIASSKRGKVLKMLSLYDGVHRGGIGERNGNARLTSGLVRDIRESQEGPRSLADRLGVSRQTIHDIRVGRTWVRA